MTKQLKSISWEGNSLNQLRSFPEKPRAQMGFQLHLVQQGLDPTNWKPFRTIGPGVKEICIHADSEYRILYIANFAECIYVLHAFIKKSKKTEKRDIEIARKRYKIILQHRKQA